MKALTQNYKIRIRITGLKYLIREDFKFAGPSMQQQSTVDEPPSKAPRASFDLMNYGLHLKS
jgi:hypothetical protein